MLMMSDGRAAAAATAADAAGASDVYIHTYIHICALVFHTTVSELFQQNDLAL